MECNEIIVNMKEFDEAAIKQYQRETELLFRLNHTMPDTEEYSSIMHELFPDIGTGSVIRSPITTVAHAVGVKLGNNVFINSGAVLMARGGIIVEDDVQMAANVQILTNNHDPYHREILTCKPVHICRGAWIGAGATIMPGIRIGRYAIVGASAVVTKDIPDYCIAVGNPAKVIKELDGDKLEGRK